MLNFSSLVVSSLECTIPFSPPPLLAAIALHAFLRLLPSVLRIPLQDSSPQPILSCVHVCVCARHCLHPPLPNIHMGWDGPWRGIQRTDDEGERQSVHCSTSYPPLPPAHSHSHSHRSWLHWFWPLPWLGPWPSGTSAASPLSSPPLSFLPLTQPVSPSGSSYLHSHSLPLFLSLSHAYTYRLPPGSCSSLCCSFSAPSPRICTLCKTSKHTQENCKIP